MTNKNCSTKDKLWPLLVFDKFSARLKARRNVIDALANRSFHFFSSFWIPFFQFLKFSLYIGFQSCIASLRFCVYTLKHSYGSIRWKKQPPDQWVLNILNSCAYRGFVAKPPINYIYFFASANIAERRVRPYV